MNRYATCQDVETAEQLCPDSLRRVTSLLLARKPIRFAKHIVGSTIVLDAMKNSWEASGPECVSLMTRKTAMSLQLQFNPNAVVRLINPACLGRSWRNTPI